MGYKRIYFFTYIFIRVLWLVKLKKMELTKKQEIEVMIEDLKTTYENIDKLCRPLLPKEEHIWKKEIYTIDRAIKLLRKLKKNDKIKNN